MSNNKIIYRQEQHTKTIYTEALHKATNMSKQKGESPTAKAHCPGKKQMRRNTHAKTLYGPGTNGHGLLGRLTQAQAQVPKSPGFWAD